MNYKYIAILLILLFVFKSKDNKKPEKFSIINRNCHSIYGPNHPKCQQQSIDSKLEHVGYFKLNTIKYPLLDININDSKVRYLVLNNKFYRFKQKYWNKAYYFKKSLFYNNDIPFRFISNYTFRGMLVNHATNRKLYAFGKKLNNINYKYLLFIEKNGLLQYAYSIPYRPKIHDGDSIYVRNKISTYGPFVFYKS
tara:strand:- start:1491 stop:2075 length:585 start_codon:yes stop_codon:yes gene_type:complete